MAAASSPFGPPNWSSSNFANIGSDSSTRTVYCNFLLCRNTFVQTPFSGGSPYCRGVPFETRSPTRRDDDTSLGLRRYVLRVHDDLQALVLVLRKRLVKAGSVRQRPAMRNDDGGIDLAGRNAFLKRRHVAVDVRLAPAHLEAFAEKGSDGKRVHESRIDAGDRNARAARTGLNQLAQNVRTIRLNFHRLLDVIDRRI